MEIIYIKKNKRPQISNYQNITNKPKNKTNDSLNNFIKVHLLKSAFMSI